MSALATMFRPDRAWDRPSNCRRGTPDSRLGQLDVNHDPALRVTARQCVTFVWAVTQIDPDRTATVEEVSPPLLRIWRGDTDRHLVPPTPVEHRRGELLTRPSPGIGNGRNDRLEDPAESGSENGFYDAVQCSVGDVFDAVHVHKVPLFCFRNGPACSRNGPASFRNGPASLSDTKNVGVATVSIRPTNWVTLRSAHGWSTVWRVP